MRQIGTIPDEAHAVRFEDLLLTLGVKSKIEADTNGWSVWIFDEDQLTQARETLAAFLENPDDARYAQSNQAATKLRKQSEKKSRKAQKQQVNVRDSWNKPFAKRCPVTFAMILISIAVAIFSRLGDETEPVISALSIISYEVHGNMVTYLKMISEEHDLRRGQLWRLFTPMFIHFGFLHIIFNMWWLRDLGSAVEFRRGSLRFLLLVLTIAGTSNLAQYLLKGPMFGGMSGVVFGLFGYIWMKSRFDYNSGFYISPNTVFMMMAVFVLCFIGVFGSIANGAHSVGLGVGLMLGYLPKAFKDWSRGIKS